jgi:DNA modification methylase
MNYQEFLEGKKIKIKNEGVDVLIEHLNPNLFDWQKHIVKWALKKGKAALFEDCGLGKTIQQLEWANQVNILSQKPVLILAPVAVQYQTQREGKKFDIDVNVCENSNDIFNGINITNYEKLHHFDSSVFSGVVLDESSILKSYMGKTKRNLVDEFKNTEFKLCCTATPNPNDNMEILNQAEFLGVMEPNEALARWFINDTMNFGKYRIKGHAESDFWAWVSSWAVCINSPSDIGFDSFGFDLPKLEKVLHTISIQHDFSDGQLFGEKLINATNIFKELRSTAFERCKFAAEIINKSDEMFIVWCNTNDESSLLKKMVNDSVEVTGSMQVLKKENNIELFQKSKVKVLITKPSICGYGLNFQHVRNSMSVGLSFSFEQRYQAIRRVWRYGQKKTVFDHIVMTTNENSVYAIVEKKNQIHDEMRLKMKNDIEIIKGAEMEKYILTESYDEKSLKGRDFEIIIGDCVKESEKLIDNSMDFCLHSPPFSSLYIYSDSLMDMGNSSNDAEFMIHYEFLIKELYRIIKPGRLVAVHCKQLVDYKSRDGEAGLRDFRGEIIRAYQKYGFKYHSEVCIWKDPVIEMQRTKSHGLLHKQVKKDSTFSRQGLPDYLVVFRKWEKENDTHEPVIRPNGFTGYIGENTPNESIDFETSEYDKEGYSIHVWQRYASPVWFDIRQTNCLNTEASRDGKDEKHICPLQLDVIERAIHLWSNPNEVVFSPFAGIGSEIYGALKLKRKGVGIELKESYAKRAYKNCISIENSGKQLEIF